MMTEQNKQRIQEILMYLLFGILTTIVSKVVQFGILAIGEYVIGISDIDPAYYYVRIVALILQWIAGVIFAFYTNRAYVFHAQRVDKKESDVQFISFTVARLFTLGLETVVNLGIVRLCQLLDYHPIKIIGILVDADVIAVLSAAVIVVITNYFLSKFIVFRTNKQ